MLNLYTFLYLYDKLIAIVSGGHHFYLGNKKLGIFYACTLGVFLIGWIVDFIRMRQLVKAHNHGKEGKSLGTAYILGLSPFGIFGAHHYYLDNVKLGLIYTFTVGIFGIGWLVDLFRMKELVRKAGLDKKSVGTAYIMSIPPFGLFGAYHYYLGNYALGITHTLTLGIFGIGWIVDLFRMKKLVKASNDPTSDHGTTKVTAYVLCVSPLGIFGAHHFFLRRYLNGGFYAATLGLFGLGWVFDMFRLPVLYERFADEDKHKYPDEAYLYWFPFGIFGIHHLYLGNKKWGLLYACTLGCLFIGWLIDGIRMFSLLKDYNKSVEDPDMNNFRICRPSCSAYKCKRCILGACGCFEKFSLQRNSTRRENPDIEMNGEASGGVTKTRDDFDVIQEMYPNEDHTNYGQTQNNNQSGTDLALVQESYDVVPDDKQPVPAYDNGAYPGDPGYDDQMLPSNPDDSYPPSYGGNDGYGHHDNTEQTADGWDQYYDENQNNENYDEQVNYDQNQQHAYDAGYAENPQYGYDANHAAQDTDYNQSYHDNQNSDEVRHHEDVNVSVQERL